MNLGITLKSAEKKLGPALPGKGEASHTMSAIRYAAGKGKKYAGVAGIQDDAVFYIHFPTPIDWSLLASKKGTPDFINDLKESGPQGEQGRAEKVAEFLRGYEAVKEKRLAKEQAAQKKTEAARRKAEAAGLRERLARFVGEHEVTLSIGGETLTVPLKIAKDKTGKVKITGTF